MPSEVKKQFTSWIGFNPKERKSTMNIKKIEIKDGVVSRKNFWPTCPLDGAGEFETLGFLRWHELLKEVRKNPSILGLNEVLVAIGSPVCLYGHVGFRFVYRPHQREDERIKMNSDPFEEPIDKFKVFTLCFIQEEKILSYGDL